MLKVDLKDKKIKEKEIIKSFKYTFYEGNVYGIVGDNAAGKSMFYYYISNLLNTKENEVIYDKGNLNENISVLIDKIDFLDSYNIIENINSLIDVDIKKVDKVLRELRIYDKKFVKYKELSMGNRQKAKIALVLLEEKNVVILDEPFNGIDAESKIVLKNKILNLKEKGKIVFITSNNLEDVEDIVDEIVLIENKVISSVKENKATFKYTVVDEKEIEINKTKKFSLSTLLIICVALICIYTFSSYQGLEKAKVLSFKNKYQEAAKCLKGKVFLIKNDEANKIKLNAQLYDYYELEKKLPLDYKKDNHPLIYGLNLIELYKEKGVDKLYKDEIEKAEKIYVTEIKKVYNLTAEEIKHMTDEELKNIKRVENND